MLQGNIRAGKLCALSERRRMQRTDGSLVRESCQRLRIILVLSADDCTHTRNQHRAALVERSGNLTRRSALRDRDHRADHLRHVVQLGADGPIQRRHSQKCVRPRGTGQRMCVANLGKHGIQPLLFHDRCSLL